MLALSRTSGYAISALARLQRPGGAWTLTKDIASAAEIPKAYLSTILNALVRHGLIEAKRGYRGGFVLARPAEKISVLRVIEAVEGHAWQEGCLLGLSRCSDERACPSHAFWKVQREKIEEFLRSLTVAQVAEFDQDYRAQLSRFVKAENGSATPRRSRRKGRRVTVRGRGGK